MFKLIFKEINRSSFYEIRKFQKENKIKKIGHSGTLDVLACGLLLVATDDDTKLIPYLKNKDKEYFVKAKLGYTSATDDAEGPIEKKSDYIPSDKEIQSVIQKFIGTIEQLPPIYSAKKINGNRAYDLARKNKVVDLKLNKVTIYEINDIKYEYPFLEFKTKVSNGTYIRSLVRDIGNDLNTGAYITYLERTMVNGLSDINKQIKMQDIINLNVYSLNSLDELKKLFNGLIKEINLVDGNYLFQYNNQNIGIIEIKENKISKQKLFGNTIIKIIS